MGPGDRSGSAMPAKWAILKRETRCFSYLSGSHLFSEHVHLEGRRASLGSLRHLEQSSHWAHWLFSLFVWW